MARTTCSSSMCWSSPRMTAPIVSSSRLSARPEVPSSNSRSSFTDALGRPGDPGDAVADLDDPAHLLGDDRRRVVGDVAGECRLDLVCAYDQLCHQSAPISLVRPHCDIVRAEHAPVVEAALTGRACAARLRPPAGSRR